MSIPTKYIVNDVRSFNNFKEKTFSGYSTKDVIAILKKKIMSNNIEEACNWCIELFLSLHIDKLYMMFLEIALKNINITNPCLPIKLYNRYKIYCNINLDLFDLRNSQIIRNHIVELCVIVCLSNKNGSLNLIKIKDEDMNLSLLSKKFKADKNYIEPYFKSNDPEEIKIILNEFIYYLNNKNYNLSVYMISWLINYDKLCTKKKKKLICHERFSSSIQKVNHTDIIWILWEIILIESQKRFNKNVYTQIQYLYELYKLYYKPGSKYKNINMYLYGIKYFTDLYEINTPIIYNNYIKIQLCLKVNSFIGQKKHMEVVKNKQISFESNNKPKVEKKSEKKSEKKQKIEKSNNKFNILYNLDKNIK